MSTNAVVSQNVTAIEAQSWTKEQMDLIKSTIAKGATQNELQLFLYRCKNMGLDPLKPGQIYFIKYGTGPGTIVVGIEGFRSKAAKTGKLAGIKREAMRNEAGKCIGARCTVHRSDWTHPAIEEVSLDEYDTGRGNWQKMPETMIKKVAEAAALRMAFPDDLGGVYTKEEMDQADTGRIVPEAPQPEDGIQEDGVIIPYGPLAKQLVHRADPAKLRDYINSIEEKAKALNKPVPPWALPMIEAAEPVIAEYENSLFRGDADDGA